MTNDQRIKLLCGMIREYDNAVSAGLAEKIIRDPAGFGEFPVLPFVGYAARLLEEFYEQQDKQTRNSGVMTGLKKLVNSTLCDDIREGMRGVFPQDGKFHICTGFAAVRLSQDIASLPHANGFDAIQMQAAYERFCPPGELQEIQMPSIREVRLFLQKIPKGGRGKHFYRYRVNETAYMDARFLLTMLLIFQGGKVYHNGKPMGPLYFKAENGDDGILLPIRPPENGTMAA